MRVLSTRVFLSQGSNGLPGPIGPPGHRGYHGPKVSYSDRGGLFMTSQELWDIGYAEIYDKYNLCRCLNLEDAIGCFVMCNNIHY